VSQPPVVSFVGDSGVGKTTLLEKVVRELKGRGYRVAVIKHSHHDFQIDHEGKDSWRFAQAGSDCVVISSRAKVAMVQQSVSGGEPPLDELVGLVAGHVDIVLTEGFRGSGKPQVLVTRATLGPDPGLAQSEHLATVSDQPSDSHASHFEFAAVPQLVDFLLAHFRLAPRVERR
jgi:molybdopterin-guanine dinucleotide biosynthesis protein MobB